MPAKLLEGAAHNFLGRPAGIGLSIIKKINSGIECGGHQLRRLVDGRSVVKSQPGTERQFADLDTGSTEVTIVHLSPLLE